MGNKRKERTGKCKPQQTDAGSEPDERAGQTDKAKDARDGAGQAEKGQWDTQGRTQAPVQLEGPPEGSRGHRGCGGMEGQERGVAGHNPGRMPGTGAQAGRTRRRGQGQGETVRGRRESE